MAQTHWDVTCQVCREAFIPDPDDNQTTCAECLEVECVVCVFPLGDEEAHGDVAAHCCSWCGHTKGAHTLEGERCSACAEDPDLTEDEECSGYWDGVMKEAS